MPEACHLVRGLAEDHLPDDLVHVGVREGDSHREAALELAELRGGLQGGLAGGDEEEVAFEV